MTPDRNLLIGIVALKQGLITAEQFREVCLLWFLNRSRRLDLLMEEKGMLTLRQRLEIEHLLDSILEHKNGDLQQTFDTLADTDLQQSLKQIENQATSEVTSVFPQGNLVTHLDQLDLPVESQSRYTLTKKHSEGGEGTLWLARDEYLRREIALKELRRDKSVSSDLRRRFVKEARITGQLEHPNIVPVFELARNPDDGEPFFTMRFVPGPTFRKKIKHYHDRLKQGKADPLEFRQLLSVFVSICNAVAFAHDRRVVHRDLKPQNVILGAFGEVVVIDWGMAKVIDKPDEPPVEVAPQDQKDLEATLNIEILDAPPTVRMASQKSDADEESHQARRVMGTPAYMAPEQARGENDKVDFSTDIYGLGSILFAVLTGDHPHHGTDTLNLLHTIIQRPTPKVRDRLPSVPAALEAVCSKAMKKEQQDRYASALALADDVNRWLADEPISVYRDPWPTKLARWTRKHRTLAQSIAGSLLAIALVATVAAVLVNRAYRNEKAAKLQEIAAKQQEAAAKKQATDNLDLALDITDTWLSGSQLMRFYPGTDKLRELLLEQAAKNYVTIADYRGDDPVLTAQAGRTWIRIGDTRRELQQDAAVLDAYQHARDTLAPLATAGPVAEQAQLDLASLLLKVGMFHLKSQQEPEAEKAFAEATRLIQSHTPPGAKLLAAKLLRAQADLEIARGDLSTGERLLTDAERRLQELLATANEQTADSFRGELASTKSQLAQLLNQLGRGDEALKKVESAVEQYGMVVAERQDDPPLLHELQIARIRFGGIAQMQGDDKMALAQYRSAVEGCEQLLRSLPGVPRYRLDLASARIGIAQIQLRLEQAPEANTEIQQAIAEVLEFIPEKEEPEAGEAPAEEAVEKNPTTIEAGKLLLEALLTASQIESDLNHNDEAKKFLGSVIQNYRKVLEPPAKPDPAAGPRKSKLEYLRGLALALAKLGQLQAKLGQADAAVASLDEAIQHFESAAAAMTGRHALLLDALAWTHEQRSAIRRQLGRDQEADADEAQAQAIRADLPLDPEYRFHLAQHCLTRSDPTAEQIAEAVEVTQDLVTRRPLNPRYWNLRAQALLRAGSYDKCLEALAQAETRRMQISPRLTSAADDLVEALALAKSGQPDAAQQALAQAQSLLDTLQPGNPDLQRLREEAEQAVAKPD